MQHSINIVHICFDGCLVANPKPPCQMPFVSPLHHYTSPPGPHFPGTTRTPIPTCYCQTNPWSRVLGMRSAFVLCVVFNKPRQGPTRPLLQATFEHDPNIWEHSAVPPAPLWSPLVGPGIDRLMNGRQLSTCHCLARPRNTSSVKSRWLIHDFLFEEAAHILVQL
jgi:hypothetical protein